MRYSFLKILDFLALVADLQKDHRKRIFWAEEDFSA